MNKPTPISADIQSILLERARLLARSPKEETPGGTMEVVVLALATEKYGIEVEFVSEIQTLPGLTTLPGVPSFWVGLVNLRGNLVPLLDLRAFLGLTPFSLDKAVNGETRPPAGSPLEQAAYDEQAASGKIVFSFAAGWQVGLLVDDVLDVRKIPLDNIHVPLHKKAGGQPRKFIRGMTTDLLTILNLKTLLTDPRLVVQDEAA